MSNKDFEKLATKYGLTVKEVEFCANVLKIKFKINKNFRNF
jgi:hypothetical protein